MSRWVLLPRKACRVEALYEYWQFSRGVAGDGVRGIKSMTRLITVRQIHTFAHFLRSKCLFPCSMSAESGLGTLGGTLISSCHACPTS